jgi:alpha-ketoglutaric semialdehyde dehydrogenase
LAEIMAQAGLPAGVFNLVMGGGATVGEVLSGAQGVDAITFTGSDTVGRGLAARAVASGQKIQLEMGGKNPLLILDDADLQVAVHCALQGAYYSTGQRCTASSRLIVTAGMHDRFVAALCQRMQQLTVGHALEPGTDIGPVVSQAQLDQDLHYLQLGWREGAHLLCGGECVERGSKGFYLTPALFTATDNTMRINREEIFGPIATIIQVADYEEGLAVANDTPFGLVSGIVTRSLAHAEDFKQKAAAGMVMVNLPTAGVDYHVPFGGCKGSSYGPREQGSYAREFYTTVKTAYTAP